MINLKNAKSDGLYKAFHSDKTLQYKTPENLYKTPITIVFIDSAVDEYQSLVNSVIPEAEVIVLDSKRDGIAQITEVLQERINIAAIHIVSHGSPGCLQLGNTRLSLDTLDDYATQLKTWSIIHSPVPTPILLYGCNVAAGDAGAEFVERLHQLTGANIAASTNLTGSAVLGGDWELEVAIGKIEVPLAFGEEAREAYTSVLAVFNVTNTNDSGAGSLRQAILDSNAVLTDDLIVFNPDLSGQTITLTSGQLEITDDLFIDGLGANNLTISGNNGGRVFLIDDENDSNFINVEIDGLTIADGRLPTSNASGAGILNFENLQLTNSIVSNNKGGSRGTGIGNVGFLKVSESVITENSNDFSGAVGGAAGIANFRGATTEIDRSTISDNASERGGGGIINSGGILRVTNSTISGNTIDATNSQSGFGGAGILNTSEGILSINNSTITNNTIELNQNNTDFLGGGIRTNSGEVSIANTIIAGNTVTNFGTATPSDVFGSFNSSGFNLIGNSTDSTGFGIDETFASQGITIITQVLDPVLRDNGGLTPTHDLVPGSPAIDAANILSGVSTDQRGVSRPFGSNPDIGAVENINNITVDILVDENDGDISAGDVSLREAILFISDGGTINFASSLTGGTIELTQGELVINQDLTIDGLGANNLTISGGNNYRVFNVNDGDNSGLIDVVIEGLTITGGSPNSTSQYGSNGGGIFNRENLTITSSTISNNTAEFSGGGIFNDGTLVIDKSTISENTAEQNFGGGIISGSNLSVLNSTISGNTAGTDGGGIYGGTGSGGTSNLIVNSSTITQNTTSGNGGGIFIASASGAFVTVSNTIIAENFDINSSNGLSPDISGNFDLTNFNLIGDGTGSTSFTNGVDGNIVGTSTNPIDPLLSPLQNNGGSTFTHALLSGSRAINVGNNNDTFFSTDQRGEARIVGGTVDIGAFESPFTPTVLPFVITPNDDIVTGTPGNDIVISGGGQDQLFGNAGDDFLDGGDGDDRMSGGEDNDTLLGGSGQDQLSGDSGDNSLDGGDGDDHLSGGEGQDTLLGGQGQDRLFGDSGDDLLNGGSGDNTLTGGFGSDIFVLSTEGKNTIVDFEDGQDLLKLDGGLTFGSLSIFEQNGDTWITTNNNQPLAFLTGVDSNLITATDFTV